MCEVHNIYGFQGKVADRAYAEYIRLPRTARNHKLPNDFQFHLAPYIEPLGCHHAGKRGYQFNDVVVIAGLGAGLGMVQAARLKIPNYLLR